MNDHAHILITGRDAILLSTRANVLRTAGYRVSTTMEPLSRCTDLRTTRLLLLCHSLSEEEREHDLATFARVSPTAKAVCLAPHAGEAARGVPALDSYGGPREMLRVVNRLLTT